MRRVRITNPVLNKNYKTFVNSDYSSGTSVTVLSNNSFAANDLLIFGEPTEELTELKQLSSVTGVATFTLASALNFSHQKGTVIYKSLWDKVSIEGRSSSAGVFAELSSIAIQWDNQQNETVYYHSAGDDNWQYRFRFQNSVTSTNSEYSPTLAGTGFTAGQVGYMIRSIRKIVQDIERRIVSDDEIIRMLNRAQDIVYARNPKYWFLLVDTYKQQTGIAATASTGVYSLATYTTYGHLDSIRYHYSSGSNSRLYHLIKKGDKEFDAIISDLNRGDDDWVRCYKLLPADSSSDNGYFQVDPEPKNNSVGRFYPNYYERMARLDSVDDETQVPISEILEDFVISMIEQIKGNETKSKIYRDLFYGPEDDAKNKKQLTGLALLDSLDAQQKRAVGQPRQIWNFRGQRAMQNYYGNPRLNRDQLKEYYMD